MWPEIVVFFPACMLTSKMDLLDYKVSCLTSQDHLHLSFDHNCGWHTFTTVYCHLIRAFRFISILITTMQNNFNSFFSSLVLLYCIVQTTCIFNSYSFDFFCPMLDKIRLCSKTGKPKYCQWIEMRNISMNGYYWYYWLSLAF